MHRLHVTIVVLFYFLPNVHNTYAAVTTLFFPDVHSIYAAMVIFHLKYHVKLCMFQRMSIIPPFIVRSWPFIFVLLHLKLCCGNYFLFPVGVKETIISGYFEITHDFYCPSFSHTKCYGAHCYSFRYYDGEHTLCKKCIPNHVTSSGHAEIVKFFPMNLVTLRLTLMLSPKKVYIYFKLCWF